MSEEKLYWSAPALAVRSALLGLLIFMATGVALVPLGNRKLSGVFYVGAAVNLGLFCGVSLAVPIMLIRRMREQMGTRARRLVCMLSYLFGWLIVPCIGLILFAGSESRITLPRWQLVLLFGMVVLFLLMAAGAAIIPRRRVE